MKLTKSKLKQIIREEIIRLNEYGATYGLVRWYEDDENGALFDIKGHGEGLTKSQVWDIRDDATDDSLVNSIEIALEDADDYDRGF